MKKIAFFLFLFSAFFPQFSFAETDNFPDIFPSSGQDAYIFGKSKEISDYIQGDLVTAGYFVRVNESVGQDIAAAGNIVQIFGDIGDDARLAGHMITVAGKVKDSLIVAGNEIIIRSGAEVGGDLWAAGRLIELNASVNGNARLMGETVTINSRISGNVKITAKEIIFGESGSIAGSLEYESPIKSISEGKVGGKTTYYKTEKWKNTEATYFEKKLRRLWSPFSLVIFISTLTVGFLFLFLVRNYWLSFSELTKKSPFTSLGVGFLMLISFPIAAFLCAVFIVGIPLSVLILLLFGVAVVIACVMDGLVVGNFLFPVTKKSTLLHIFGSFAFGTLVLFLLPLIPFFGCTLIFLIFLMALGSLGRCHKDLFLAMQKAKKI